MNSLQLRYALLTYIEFPTIVCAIDQLHLIQSKDFFLICNNQPSTESGMHWVSFCKINKNLEFFDSFGLPIQYYGTLFSEFVERHGGKVKQCYHQFQSDSSDLCGGYCLYFLISRAREYSYENIIESFSTTNTKLNDWKINLFIKHNLIFPKFSKCGQICEGKCLANLSSVCIQKNNKCSRISHTIKSV